MLCKNNILEEVFDEVDRAFDILELAFLQEHGILGLTHCFTDSPHCSDTHYQWQVCVWRKGILRLDMIYRPPIAPDRDSETLASHLPLSVYYLRFHGLTYCPTR